MSSEACKHQAFIHGKRTIGLQFHLEATQVGIKDMISNHQHELGSDDFVQTEEEIKYLMQQHIGLQKKWMHALLDAFVLL